MAERVFFHVGVPKSGTTFLQTTMWHNRKKLAAQGILYPGRKRMDHYHASEAVRGVPPERIGEDADAWDRIVAELAAWKGTGLISHEFFSMATARQARRAVRALAPAEVHVVVTGRDYARQFPAVWQEALKMNSDLGLDEFMKRAFARELRGAWSWKSQDLPRVLRRWARAVEPENVHLITLPPPGVARDVLWRRWCQVVGIDDRDFDLELKFGNESIGVAQAALLRRVKPHLSGPLMEGPVRHRWVRQYFGHEVLGPQRGERFGVRAGDAAQLRAESIAATRAIAAAGYEVVGDLEDLVPPADPPEMPHPDDVSEAEMLEVAARAIDQMIRDVRDLTNERNAWRTAAERASADPIAWGATRARRAIRRVRRRLTR